MTPDEIAQLRRMAGLADDDAVYTDEVLELYFDNLGGDLNAVAAAIWGEKAASASSLVDVTESGSSRRLSQLQSQFLAMQKEFGGDGASTGGKFVGTVEIDRP